MMERFYTTIEQSDKLVALGLDPQTCDMSYWMDNNKEFQIKIGKDVAIANNLFSFRNGYTKPCWSLVALLNLIPNFELITHDVNGAAGSYRENYIDTGFHQTEYRTSLVDGAFEMVVYLLESEQKYGKDGYIKTRQI